MSLKEKGYYIVNNFLEEDFVKFIQSYFFNRIESGEAIIGDPQAPNSYCFYGDALMDTILGNSTESLSKIVDYDLVPTYTYTRLYGKGDELKKHRDRNSCEISATLALGVPDGEEINPIYFSHNEDESDAIEVILRPGDLCFYKGCDLHHWRKPFTQKWYLQGFLHFVDANGPNLNCKYDMRTYLTLPKN